MKCVAFKRLERGSLQGFADISLDSGLILLGCTLHTSNGKKWCNPPGRPQLDADRKLMLDPAGKPLYAPTIAFVEAGLRYRWSDEAVAAVDRYLNSTKPATAGSMSRVAPSAGNQWGLDG